VEERPRPERGQLKRQGPKRQGRWHRDGGKRVFSCAHARDVVLGSVTRNSHTLVWIARMCMVEISYAASQITSVMAMPSKVAWEAALGTLRWLVEGKTQKQH
jgi:hypothetical protein